MKKFLMGAVGLLALGMAAPASAADMAVEGTAARLRWSGDLQLDRLLHRRQRRLGSEPQLPGISFDVCWLLGTSLTAAPRGPEVVVGGQIGYRWQANQWVFGVEAQGDWADLSSTRVSPFFDPRRASRTRTKTDGIGLFTGQIGYAWNAALFYVKGGAAVTSNRFSILDNA